MTVILLLVAIAAALVLISNFTQIQAPLLLGIASMATSITVGAASVGVAFARSKNRSVARESSISSSNIANFLQSWNQLEAMLHDAVIFDEAPPVRIGIQREIADLVGRGVLSPEDQRELRSLSDFRNELVHSTDLSRYEFELSSATEMLSRVRPRIEAALTRGSGSVIADLSTQDPDVETGDSVKAAELLKGGGSLEDVRSHLERTLERDPHSTSALYNLAGILTQQGEFDEAVALYERALSMNPDSTDVLYNLAGLLVQRSRMFGSLEDLDRAVALYGHLLAADPNSARGLYNLAGALEQRYEITADRADLDEAIDLYRRVLVIDPNLPSALYNLAGIQLRRGEPNTAAEIYRRALGATATESKDSPQIVNAARFGLATALEQMGMPNEARREFKSLLQAPEREVSSRAALNLGLLMSQVGDYQQARESYERAIAEGDIEVSGLARRLLDQVGSDK